MVKYNKFLDNIDQINEISNIARQGNVAHLFTEDGCLDGKCVFIKGRKLRNFGSFSYTDPHLKAAAIEAIQKYNNQFSSSWTYISFTLY